MSHSSPTEPARENDPETPPATIGESPTSHECLTESAPEDFPEEAPPPTKGRWKVSTTGGRKSRWPTFAALAIAVVAAGLAIVAWFRPPHGASPTFTSQQIADAKTNVCSAYTAVQQGVVINTHLVNPRADDPIGTLAVAANARLALLGGGAYLRDRLAAEPAAPADLAKAVKSMANTIEQLGINYLAGASNLVQDPLRNDLNSEIAQINGLCA
jgi:hypothetical protein